MNKMQVGNIMKQLVARFALIVIFSNMVIFAESTSIEKQSGPTLAASISSVNLYSSEQKIQTAPLVLSSSSSYSKNRHLRTDIWEKVGSNIRGADAYDNTGQSTAISGDGKRIIVGSRGNDNNGDDSGHSRVFQLVGGKWKKVGSDIEGEAAGDRAGLSVDINEDGSRVVVGSPNNNGNGERSGHARVFQEENGIWIQIGSAIEGEAAEDTAGYSVAMSSDGNRVVIGSRGNDENGSNSGHARIFDLVNSTAWENVGRIRGEAAGDNAGSSVGISADGKTVIVGSPTNDENGHAAGHVRIYKDMEGKSSKKWKKIGSNIVGVTTEDNAGMSVAISADARRVIIGSPYNDDNGDSSGHARVFRQHAEKWHQYGSTIKGIAAYDNLGYSVAINADGTLIMVGSPNSENSGENSGYARIFKDNNGEWEPLGSDLEGLNAGDRTGYSVAMSSDGMQVVLGSPFSNGGKGDASGHISVFDLLVLSPSPSQMPSSAPSLAPSTSSAPSPAPSSSSAPSSKPSPAPSVMSSSRPSASVTISTSSAPSAHFIFTSAAMFAPVVAILIFF